eukprot:scaffold801_cov170-Amphora_coffeaeformis.AAC.5
MEEEDTVKMNIEENVGEFEVHIGIRPYNGKIQIIQSHNRRTLGSNPTTLHTLLRGDYYMIEDIGRLDPEPSESV